MGSCAIKLFYNRIRRHRSLCAALRTASVGKRDEGNSQSDDGIGSRNFSICILHDRRLPGTGRAERTRWALLHGVDSRRLGLKLYQLRGMPGDRVGQRGGVLRQDCSR